MITSPIPSRGHILATELLDALNNTPANRAGAIKALYSRCLFTSSGGAYGLQAKLRKALNASPISRVNVHNGVNMKRKSISELKDYIPWPVTAALLAAPILGDDNAISLEQVFRAIEDPAQFGVQGGRAKHGWRFGMPSKMNIWSPSVFIREMVVDLNEALMRENTALAVVPFDTHNFVAFSSSAQPSSTIAPTTTEETDMTSINQGVAAILAAVAYEHDIKVEEYREEWGTEIVVGATELIPNAIAQFKVAFPDQDVAPIQAAVELALQDDGRFIFANNPTVEPEVAAMVAKMLDKPATPTVEASPTVQTLASNVVVDPSFAPMIDALMDKATNGSFSSIEAMADALNTQQGALVGMTEQVTKAQENLKIMTSQQVIATAATAVPINGIVTTWEMKNAAEIFRTPGGKKTRSLDFEVPVFTHTDSSGQVVDHPMVPALDPNYVPRRGLIIKFLIGMIKKQNIFLYGHTGTGKSTLPLWIAAMLNMPAMRVNLDGNIERADLVGEKTLSEVNGATVSEWIDGVVPQAMGMACMLIFDEIDAGRPEVMFVVQRALEGAGLLLTEDGGRLVTPHPMFMFAATANTRGQGDEYGVYPGTRPLNAATLDRFTNWIEVEYLNTKDEEKLIAAHAPVVEDTVIKQMVQFATELRAGFLDGEMGITVSPRGLMALATDYALLSTTTPDKSIAMKMALDMTMIGRVPDDGRQRVIEIADRCFK